MSSRYSSYSSRYGSGRDYGSGSSSYSRDRDTNDSGSSYRDRDRDSSSYSSRFSSKPKYSSYVSKYSNYGNNKMEAAQAPLAEDVLQESQISDFAEEEATHDHAPIVEAEELLEDEQQPVEEAEVKLTLAAQIDDKVESEDEERDEVEQEEVRKVQDLLSGSTRASVKFADIIVADEDDVKEGENRTPSPSLINAKKIGDVNWPPKPADVKKELQDTEALPKKNVRDLIAKFNIGVSSDEKKDEGYKAEYGAGAGNVGKIRHAFA